MLLGMSPFTIMATHLQRESCCCRGPQAASRGAGSPKRPHPMPGRWSSFPGNEPGVRDTVTWPEDPQGGQQDVKAWRKAILTMIFAFSLSR